MLTKERKNYKNIEQPERKKKGDEIMSRKEKRQEEETEKLERVGTKRWKIEQDDKRWVFVEK